MQIRCKHHAVHLAATPRRLKQYRATVRALALAIVSLIPIPVLAEPGAARWHELRQAFEAGARHGTAWNYGWGSVYGASLAHSIYTLEDTSDSDDRLDAQVSALKSALALADTVLNPQPHAAALERFNQLAVEGSPEALEQAERLRAEIAHEEQRRRQLDARLQPLIVNLIGGLVIALGDDRPKDGAINFATGMLVTELAIWTQPSAAARLGAPEREVSLGIGTTRVDARYGWLASPDRVAVYIKF